MELASGVDSFYLSGRVQLPPAVLADLERKRDAARATRTPQGLDVDGESFSVVAGSLNKYAFRLEHENGTVGITEANTCRR